MDTLIQDLRFALRTLRSAPGFTAVVILTLALGIGANTAVFSVVDAVLLRPLPYAEPDRLANSGYLLRGEYRVVREESRSLRDIAIYQQDVGVNLSGHGEDPERIASALTSANLFPLLGARPLLGRTFLPEEEDVAGAGVVVISHGLWRARFGGDPAIIGRDILVDGEPRAVVGVMPAGFGFPGGATRLWQPLRLDTSDPAMLWGGGGGATIARLPAGIGTGEAQAELRSLAPRLREANTLWRPPPTYGEERTVAPLKESLVGDARTRLYVAFGAVGLVLLMACANIANLQLARAAHRQREMALRTALGAGRGRIVRQLLTESVVLAVLGGMVGIAIASWGEALFVGALPADTPRLAEIGMDARVLGFTIAVTLGTGVLFGLLPAIRVARTDVHGALKDAGRGAGVGGGRRQLSGALVAAEVAIAVVLVTGAGLMIRSLAAMQRVDPGFRAEQVVTARVTPPEPRYGSSDAKRAFFREVVARVEALPGVLGADLTNDLPLQGWPGGFAFEVEGRPYVPGTAAPVVNDRRITPGYLATMGIPLRGGRALEESDRERAPRVALVNETMARTHWPDEDPIGKRFRPVWWREGWIEVVGVVADVRQEVLSGEVEPEAYRPMAQEPVAAFSLVVRGSSEPRVLLPRLRTALAAVDPDVPLSDVRTLEQVRSASLAEPRFTTVLLATFAAIALLLGALGIYGVGAYAVSQRRREIGIRMALGARSADVLRMVVTHGIVLAAAGVGAGLLVSLAATRALSSLLYGVGRLDPVTFLAVPVVLAVVAVLASYLPARRAARVDPLVSLRAE